MEQKRILELEINTAKALRAKFAELIAEDETFAADLIEGQTNLNEAIGGVIEQMAADLANIEGLTAYIEKFSARKDRLKTRVEKLKEALFEALKQAGRRKEEHSMATVSVRKTPRAVVVENEKEIPASYWIEQDPKLDKKTLAADLKKGYTVAGAKLSEQGETLSISWK